MRNAAIVIYLKNCILINFERTHGWTDEPKAICIFNFSQIGGIIKCEGIINFKAIFENPKANENTLFRKYVIFEHLANDLYL